MITHNPAMPIQPIDIHALSEAELDGVNGGLFPIVIAVWAIAFGITAGLAYCAVTSPMRRIP